METSPKVDESLKPGSPPWAGNIASVAVEATKGKMIERIRMELMYAFAEGYQRGFDDGQKAKA